MPNDDSIFRFQKLDVYVVVKELVRLVHEGKIAHKELRDQAQRAAVSCFLQLAEGLPNGGAGMRQKYFTEANNSLHELVAAVDLSDTLGALPAAKAQEIQELGVRAKRMLRALMMRS